MAESDRFGSITARNLPFCQRFGFRFFQNLPHTSTQLMPPEERQAKIEAYLQRAEFSSLEELAQHVGVSVSTVRRDVAALHERGVVKRTHGGARSLQAPKSDEFVFNVRDSHEVSEKAAIGEACAALIQPGQNVMI